MIRNRFGEAVFNAASFYGGLFVLAVKVK